jgi:hypothetical protein
VCSGSATCAGTRSPGRGDGGRALLRVGAAHRHAIWGKPIWGVYWSWDARLTATLILFLIFGAYLLARAVSDPLDEQTARYAAVFAIIGVAGHPDHPDVRALVAHAAPAAHRDSSRTRAARRDADRPGDRLVAIITLAVWLIVCAPTERAASDSPSSAPRSTSARGRVMDHIEYLFAGFAVFWAGLFVYLLLLQFRRCARSCARSSGWRSASPSTSRGVPPAPARPLEP